MTQAEFAATSNVSRNTLGTLLRSLQDAGLVLIGYGKIRPLQSEKLRALVEAGSAWRESGAGDGNHQETGCATSRTPRAAQTRDTVSNRG